MMMIIVLQLIVLFLIWLPQSGEGFVPAAFHMRNRGHSKPVYFAKQYHPLYCDSSRSTDDDNKLAATEDNTSLSTPSSSSSSSSSTTIPTKAPSVGDPQKREKVEYSIDSIMKELKAINQEGTRKYCILGTRHCSYLHQQIIELLSYALILSGNHVFTSGAGGTNAAAIRGALRADESTLLTVVLPQSLKRQPKESQVLLEQVTNLIQNPKNDDLSLDAASRLCNSELLSQTDQLICFAFHDSNTVIEASREAKVLDKVVTVLYLD
ncbi:hypothetical protein TrST_g13008 [Triparma strigata]|uniref:DNA recombination-mediator protein A n=1 Tax=Triparma strigata TaxID=1606541 RepID=A0A9W7DYY8_9STRA|nr:hypothetical protein TrST_g13008 [Triparma strigata]